MEFDPWKDWEGFLTGGCRLFCVDVFILLKQLKELVSGIEPFQSNNDRWMIRMEPFSERCSVSGRPWMCSLMVFAIPGQSRHHMGYTATTWTQWNKGCTNSFLSFWYIFLVGHLQIESMAAGLSSCQGIRGLVSNQAWRGKSTPASSSWKLEELKTFDFTRTSVLHRKNINRKPKFLCSFVNRSGIQPGPRN